MLIDANHLALTLQGQRILSDTSLHLWRGDIYGLLGPNGAGKSTTIALLLGLYPADSGKLRLFDSTEADPVALRRRIGVMPEHAGFYDWMSANDYLVWHAGFYGGLQQSVAELLEQVGLADTGHKPISQFSRGMTQRLALARALVHDPELLILDEPTNGLDPRGRREVHDLLLQLAKERQVGILLCTHLLDDVERLCSTIGIIDQGRTVIEGTLAELLGSDAAVLRYRLRMSQVPEAKTLPKEVKLVRQEGGWWHVEVAAAALPKLPGLWQQLTSLGWTYTEIHAEGGGLEELYLHLTTHPERVDQEQAV